MGIMEAFRQKLMGNKELYAHNHQAETNQKFGPVPGLAVFTTCPTREELRKCGLHIHTTAGISGSSEGAYSIVMSGGYVDDVDEGEFISYTGTGGTGGRDDSFGGDRVHKTDQTFKHPHNRSLKKSAETGKPVRVIRGHSLKTKYAPPSGYRYDGLYRVIRTYETRGKDGYIVLKFELRRLEGQPPLPVRRE